MKLLLLKLIKVSNYSAYSDCNRVCIYMWPSAYTQYAILKSNNIYIGSAHVVETLVQMTKYIRCLFFVSHEYFWSEGVQYLSRVIDHLDPV